MHRTLFLGLIAVAGCAGGDSVAVIVTPEDETALAAFVGALDDERVELVVAEDPLLARSSAGLTVTLLPDGSCTDCYTLSGNRREVSVSGGGLLGRQYGLADVLEQVGYRFHHPLHTVVPASLGRVDEESFGALHSPQIARRGIHMHTLHPIEGLFDFWEPGEDHLRRAARVVDWVVKNRGNHLQWVSLDDILRPEVGDPWREHTAAIHASAHERGLTVGVGVQLFGSGNLQNAYDLLDEVGTEEEQIQAIAARSEVLLGGLEWDLVNLSFGEFFGEDPETFIHSADLAVQGMLDVDPDLELSSVIHVGDDLRLTYDGQDIIYYFLATYADERLVPWVHTVMYFNLFDPALGAYHHEDFADHQALLLDRIEAGEPVGYFPESAYWIAFDNSVPTYLPIYVESRHRDLRRTQEAVGALPPAHVLFSSGWEWGYWQTDVATLRMSYELPEGPGALYEQMFAPWEQGEAIADLLTETSDVQHQWLITRGLSAYLAAVDVVMEIGYDRDIISQPKRELVADVAAYDDAERAAFASVVDDMDGMATAFEALAAQAATVDTIDRYTREVVDGIELTAHRARFIERVYAGVLADDASLFDAAQAELDAGRLVVERRHADLHDDEPGRLVEPRDNATIYDYGYLIRADELCFWERDLAQARNAVEGAGVAVPGCF